MTGIFRPCEIGYLLRESQIMVTAAYDSSVASRKQFGSWLDGTPEGNSETSAQRADRLGLPERGPGSQAGLGRRLVGLSVDWLAASVVSWLLFDYNAMATLAVFALQHFLFVSSLGYSIGHFVAGLRVRPEESGNSFVGFVRGFLRTALLCLVVPAVVWDGDGRGLHDKAARTYIVRR